MSFFKADNYAQIPTEYKALADFIFVEESVPYGSYPTKKFRCVKQPAMDTPERIMGVKGSQSYTETLQPRVVPGTVVVTGPTVDAEDPTNVVLTDDGKDFYKLALDANNHFTIKSAVTGPLGYYLTIMPQPVAYEDEDNKVIQDVDLAASFASNHLTVKLGLEDSAGAVAEVGDSNKIEIEFDKHGEHGNDWEVEIESDNTVVQALAVSRNTTAKVLTIRLATGAVADDPASLAVESGGAGTTSVVTVEATAAGAYDGVLGNDIEVVFEDEGSANLSASYNEGVITVNFGGDATATPTAVAGVINGITGFDATVTTDEENFASADDLGSKGFLEGGTNLLDAVANTRTLVKTAVELLEIDDLQAWSVNVGAHGAVAFTSTDDGTYEFADGDDGGELDDTKNTLATLRATIHALTAFECTAVTGSGVVDEDELLDQVVFNSYLVDSGGTERGEVNRTTGLMSVNFGVNTVLDPTVIAKHYRYNRAKVDNPTNIALAYPQYTTVYVDLRGEGRIYHSAHPFSR